MPVPRTAEDVLAFELKEIHSAEKQLSRMLPKVMKRIASDRLLDFLQERLEQGAALMEEVDAALDNMDTAKSRPKNVVAEALIEQISDHMEAVEEDTVLETVLLASIQKIEHYCIAAWGTAAALGRLLGNRQVTTAMERALKAGKRLDEELTALAEEEINPAMLEQEEQPEQQEASRSGRRRAKV